VSQPSAAGQRAPDVSPAETRRAIERWFIAEGVPHFIVEYSASRSVLTRAAPVLVLYVVSTTILAARLGATLVANVLAVAVAFLLVLGAWASLNVARGRPWRSLPRKVGAPEVLAFLLIPAIPPLMLGLQVSDAVIAVVESALFLVVVYLATSYGLVAVTRWAFRRLASQWGSLGRLLTRALPLLMVFIVFAFVQSDTWRLAYAMGTDRALLLLALFIALAGFFLVGQLAPEIRRLSEGRAGWPETLAIARGTPAAPLCDELDEAGPRTRPMRWHEWVNVGTVVVFGQGLQIVLVMLAVQIVLVGFGMLLVPVWLQSEWAGAPVPVLVSFTLLGGDLAVTSVLVTVSLFLGACSGLYFTVSALSDTAYREEFFSEADQELARVFAVRTVYRTALARDLEPTASAAPPADRPAGVS
jgi:hypothetical protein